jgi:co-chaperonin GroES (HSP10)
MPSETEKGKELVERQLYATQTANTVVVQDGSNKVSIPGFPYIFSAKWDNILVSVDIYKSGYECKECKGSGSIKQHCSCENHDRPGYKYSNQVLDDLGFSDSNLALARKEIKCPECNGNYISHRVDAPCAACGGKGALIYIPDQSKVLPTTGVIVSVGSSANPEFKCGMRVLFGAYTGVMVPTKAPGIAFKVIRDIQILCEIEGGEDMAAFDFVVPDKEL